MWSEVKCPSSLDENVGVATGRNYSLGKKAKAGKRLNFRLKGHKIATEMSLDIEASKSLNVQTTY